MLENIFAFLHRNGRHLTQRRNDVLVLPGERVLERICKEVRTRAVHVVAPGKGGNHTCCFAAHGVGGDKIAIALQGILITPEIFGKAGCLCPESRTSRTPRCGLGAGDKVIEVVKIGHR